MSCFNAFVSLSPHTHTIRAHPRPRTYTHTHTRTHALTHLALPFFMDAPNDCCFSWRKKTDLRCFYNLLHSSFCLVENCGKRFESYFYLSMEIYIEIESFFIYFIWSRFLKKKYFLLFEAQKKCLTFEKNPIHSFHSKFYCKAIVVRTEVDGLFGLCHLVFFYTFQNPSSFLLTFDA